MKLLILLAFLFVSLAASAESIKDAIETKALDYFLKEAHPVSGLVRDRAQNFKTTPSSNKVASMASTGFGLAVVAHAAKFQKMDLSVAREYVLKTLVFSRDHVPRYKGWFLHFVNWETGERVWKSEYSTIDTALFMAGALYASQVLNDPEITQITNTLYREMDFWDMMTDGGKRPKKRTLTLGYLPEEGYNKYQWKIYAEQIILLVLGLGHPTRPIPIESWDIWNRGNMGADMPLFIHQYSLLYVDFRKFDDYGRNYFSAGLKATKRQRNKFAHEGFWGLSAGESSNGYAVFTPKENNKTFCIGCAIGSLMFAPEDIYKDAEKWLTHSQHEKFWGQYGFSDSINTTENWYSTEVLGITKGPEYLSSVNTEESTSIWSDFMKNEFIVKAMSKLR